MIFSASGWTALATIILVCLGLVAIIRRWVAELPWAVGAVCLGLSLAALGPSLYRDTLPVPVDEVARGYPHRGVVGEITVGNPLTNDTTRQMLPWMQCVRESFARFESPLWNPFSFAGYPLLANGQSAPFSPFFLATLAVPLPHQIVAMAGLKLFVALLLTSLLLHERGTRWGAALSGGVLFAMSVFQTVYLYYPVTAVTSLLPALLFFIHRSLANDRRAVDRLGVALVTAAILAGGHPESAFHCAVAGALYLPFAAPEGGWRQLRWWRRTLPGLATTAFLGVLVAAPAWLPFLEQVVHSDRMHEIPGRSMTPMRPLNEWQLLGHPDRFGNPAHGDWHGSANYCVAAPTYTGLVLMALVLASLVTRRDQTANRWLIAGGAAFFIIALGWPPLAWLNRVPPFLWSANDRLRFAGILFLVLGALPVLDRPRRERAAPLTLGAVGAVAVWWFSWGRHVSGNPGVNDVVAPALTVVLVFLAWVVADRRRRVLGLVAATLVSCEMLTLTRDFNAACDRRLFRPRLPIVDALRQYAGGKDPARIAGHDWTLLPNASAQYGLEDVRGSDPMAWRPYLDFLDLAANPRRLFGIRRITRVVNPALDFLGVRYVLAAPEARRPKAYELLYSGADGQLWLNPRALPRFFIPELIDNVATHDEALRMCREIKDFRRHAVVEGWQPPDQHELPAVELMEVQRLGVAEYSLRARADVPGVVVSSIPAVPGWRCTMDGAKHPVIVANSAFLALPIPVGEHRLRVTYRPRSFDIALWMHGLGLLGIAWDIRRRGREHPGERGTTV